MRDVWKKAQAKRGRWVQEKMCMTAMKIAEFLTSPAAAYGYSDE